MSGTRTTESKTPASPRTDRDPGERSTDKREAILEAALELFGERGFHGTAVPLVAERARVGAGTIYRYFESKEALANVLFRLWKGEMGRMLLEDFPFTAPPREQFRHWWQRMITYATTYPKAMAFLELHHHARYLDEESCALEERILRTAHTLVDSMRKAQVVKDVPAELLIALVLGGFHGLLKAAWLGYVELTEETIAAAETCCWEAIRR